MGIQKNHINSFVRFKRWSRSRYAAFCSLKNVVHIGVVKASICDASLKKSLKNGSCNIINQEQEKLLEQAEEEGPEKNSYSNILFGAQAVFLFCNDSDAVATGKQLLSHPIYITYKAIGKFFPIAFLLSLM